MIFIDTNVFIYAVGRPHPLQGLAREFFLRANRDRTPLATSAEVLQELLHAYLPVGRLETLDAAMSLVTRAPVEVLPLQAEDVALARQLHGGYPVLGARDLCHLAVCRRRGVNQVKTFDRDLLSAFDTMFGARP